jgi:hypothetical protein
LTPFVSQEAVITYPSPARGKEVWFYYYLDEPSQVEIECFNLIGEKGSTLSNTHASSGYQRTQWDIRNVAPGIYFYRMRITGMTQSKTIGPYKLVIVKSEGK